MLLALGGLEGPRVAGAPPGRGGAATAEPKTKAGLSGPGGGQRFPVVQSRAWKQRRGCSYRAALVDQEAAGPRWVGHIGQVAWLTPFTPSGFHEVWAVLGGAADVTELTEQDTRALGQGLSQA